VIGAVGLRRVQHYHGPSGPPIRFHAEGPHLGRERFEPAVDGQRKSPLTLGRPRRSPSLYPPPETSPMAEVACPDHAEPVIVGPCHSCTQNIRISSSAAT
jgi:hypothetical protein